LPVEHGAVALLPTVTPATADTPRQTAQTGDTPPVAPILVPSVTPADIATMDANDAPDPQEPMSPNAPRRTRRPTRRPTRPVATPTDEALGANEMFEPATPTRFPDVVTPAAGEDIAQDASPAVRSSTNIGAATATPTP